MDNKKEVLVVDQQDTIQNMILQIMNKMDEMFDENKRNFEEYRLETKKYFNEQSEYFNKRFNKIIDETDRNFENLFNKLDAYNEKFVDEWNEESDRPIDSINEVKLVEVHNNKEVEVKLAADSTFNVVNNNEDVAIELYDDSDRPIGTENEVRLVEVKTNEIVSVGEVSVKPIETVSQARLDLEIENKINLVVNKDMIVNAKQGNQNVCYDDTIKYKSTYLKKVRWIYWQNDRGFDLFLGETEKVILSEDVINVGLNVFKSNSGIRCDKIDNGHYGRLGNIEMLGNKIAETTVFCTFELDELNSQRNKKEINVGRMLHHNDRKVRPHKRNEVMVEKFLTWYRVRRKYVISNSDIKNM